LVLVAVLGPVPGHPLTGIVAWGHNPLALCSARFPFAGRFSMPPNKRHPLDKNVSPSWKPVPSLQARKPGMDWSDRLYHGLKSLAGLAIMGCGVVVMAYLGMGKLGGGLIGAGFVTFILGFPSQAERNGYPGL
jgi:hypothetical protein